MLPDHSFGHTGLEQVPGRRGHQVAAVATARKMAVLAWHLLIRKADYLWLRPALLAYKLRAPELQTGRPMQKGKGARAPQTRPGHRDQAARRGFQPLPRCLPRGRLCRSTLAPPKPLPPIPRPVPAPTCRT